MKRRIGIVTLAVMLCSLVIAPIAFGADAGRVTQTDMAKMLVNVLGLSRFVSAEPTAQECFATLMDSGIAPMDGWQADAVVNRANFLDGMGINITTIGEAVGELDALPEPVARNVFVASTTGDPLEKRDKFAGETEREFATDIGYNMVSRPITMSELRKLINEIEFKPQPRPPVTPD